MAAPLREPSVPKAPARTKHVPQRTCIGCRQVNPKRGLIRLVANAEGRVEVDPTGKKPGRGAYLCLEQRCWESALKKRTIDHALRTDLRPEDRAALLRYMAELPRSESQTPETAIL